MMLAGSKFARQPRLPRDRHRQLTAGQTIQIGEFTVTVFSVDHSIYGALIEVHTSGHIFHSDIVELVGLINAKSVIPVHTFEPEKFDFVVANVRILNDGETLDVI